MNFWTDGVLSVVVQIMQNREQMCHHEFLAAVLPKSAVEKGVMRNDVYKVKCASLFLTIIVSGRVWLNRRLVSLATTEKPYRGKITYGRDSCRVTVQVSLW